MRSLRWSAIVLALVACWLPALRGSLLLLGSEQWSLVTLATGHSDINRLVNETRSLQTMFDVHRGAQWLTVAQSLPTLLVTHDMGEAGFFGDRVRKARIDVLVAAPIALAKRRSDERDMAQRP